ncbi:papain-like cysteine protease family protein [Streptomyces inhibens]|uniref:papain-like cysteine protease family protein n=1 Tax=Streptomyces inhibens TaxID=2293571 RepID=UPI001EE6F35B|nr:papain-like cysteine protease family protein [Streptomyces inhibens]UKY49507.1 C39 family peptidase [Streptomyces inhibens]
MTRAPHARRSRRRWLSAAALTAAALTTLTGTTTASATPLAPPSHAVTASDTAAAPFAANRLDISMQAQEKTNWCWAASGNTIATWYGRNYSQNEFCNAAFNRQQGTTCPNNQANLGNVQNAFDWMGINSGSYVSGWLRYSTVQSEIDADRPIETRIQWSSGGGHMHVIYGYDTDRNWVYWGDPWGSNYRYNWGDFDYYVNGSSFSWTHSLYRIGA